MIEELFVVIANEQVLQFMFKNAHWNLTDAGFLELHKFFDEQFDNTISNIDTMSERVRQLGEKIPFNVEFLFKHSLTTTNLFDGLTQNKSEFVSKLCNLLEETIHQLKYVLSFVDSVDSSDTTTNDIIIQIIRQKEKSLWLLKSNL